jgi:hypothetical protein
MPRIGARSTAKVAALKTSSSRISWLFISYTVLTVASLVPMWSHWTELSDLLGFYRAAGALMSVTGAGVFFAWWLTTGNS